MLCFGQVKSFRTADEVDEFLYNNPMTCPGALHFKVVNATVISYGVQSNSTTLAKRGIFEDPTFKFQIPLQIAAEREIARSLIGGTGYNGILFYILCKSCCAYIYIYSLKCFISYIIDNAFAPIMHGLIFTHVYDSCLVPNFSWVVRLAEFAHPALEIFSALDTAGPAFFLATAMFGFVFQMTSLITEKELKLRQVLISPCTIGG